MTTIRALIIDDEPENIALMEYLLKVNCPRLEVVGTAKTVKDAQYLVSKENPDLLLLDIELSGGETGFDLLESIRSWEDKPHVVFVTAYDHYALKAMKFHAFDYILKPISIQELKQTIEEVSVSIEKNRNRGYSEILDSMTYKQKSQQGQDFLAISHADQIQLIAKKDIIFLRASGKYTEIHTTENKRVLSSRNLGEYEQILDQNFLRVHHSYILNIHHLVNIEKEYSWVCILTQGHKIPVSRRKKTDLYTALQLRVK